MVEPTDKPPEELPAYEQWWNDFNKSTRNTFDKQVKQVSKFVEKNTKDSLDIKADSARQAMPWIGAAVVGLGALLFNDSITAFGQGITRGLRSIVTLGGALEKISVFSLLGDGIEGIGSFFGLAVGAIGSLMAFKALDTDADPVPPGKELDGHNPDNIVPSRSFGAVTNKAKNSLAAKKAAKDARKIADETKGLAEKTDKLAEQAEKDAKAAEEAAAKDTQNKEAKNAADEARKAADDAKKAAKEAQEAAKEADKKATELEKTAEAAEGKNNKPANNDDGVKARIANQKAQESAQKAAAARTIAQQATAPKPAATTPQPQATPDPASPPEAPKPIDPAVGEALESALKAAQEGLQKAVESVSKTINDLGRNTSEVNRSIEKWLKLAEIWGAADVPTAEKNLQDIKNKAAALEEKLKAARNAGEVTAEIESNLDINKGMQKVAEKALDIANAKAAKAASATPNVNPTPLPADITPPADKAPEAKPEVPKPTVDKAAGRPIGEFIHNGTVRGIGAYAAIVSGEQVLNIITDHVDGTYKKAAAGDIFDHHGGTYKRIISTSDHQYRDSWFQKWGYIEFRNNVDPNTVLPCDSSGKITFDAAGNIIGLDKNGNPEIVVKKDDMIKKGEDKDGKDIYTAEYIKLDPKDFTQVGLQFFTSAAATDMLLGTKATKFLTALPPKTLGAVVGDRLKFLKNIKAGAAPVMVVTFALTESMQVGELWMNGEKERAAKVAAIAGGKFALMYAHPVGLAIVVVGSKMDEVADEYKKITEQFDKEEYQTFLFDENGKEIPVTRDNCHKLFPHLKNALMRASIAKNVSGEDRKKDVQEMLKDPVLAFQTFWNHVYQDDIKKNLKKPLATREEASAEFNKFAAMAPSDVEPSVVWKYLEANAAFISGDVEIEEGMKSASLIAVAKELKRYGNLRFLSFGTSAKEPQFTAPLPGTKTHIPVAPAPVDTSAVKNRDWANDVAGIRNALDKNDYLKAEELRQLAQIAGEEYGNDQQFLIRTFAALGSFDANIRKKLLTRRTEAVATLAKELKLTEGQANSLIPVPPDVPAHAYPHLDDGSDVPAPVKIFAEMLQDPKQKVYGIAEFMPSDGNNLQQPLLFKHMSPSQKVEWLQRALKHVDERLTKIEKECGVIEISANEIESIRYQHYFYEGVNDEPATYWQKHGYWTANNTSMRKVLTTIGYVDLKREHEFLKDDLLGGKIYSLFLETEEGKAYLAKSELGSDLTKEWRNINATKAYIQNQIKEAEQNMSAHLQHIREEKQSGGKIDAYITHAKFLDASLTLAAKTGVVMIAGDTIGDGKDPVTGITGKIAGVGNNGETQWSWIQFKDLRTPRTKEYPTGTLHYAKGEWQSSAPGSRSTKFKVSILTDEKGKEHEVSGDNIVLDFSDKGDNRLLAGAIEKIHDFTPEQRYYGLIPANMQDILSLPAGTKMAAYEEIVGDNSLTPGKKASVHFHDSDTRYTLAGTWTRSEDQRLYLKPEMVTVHTLDANKQPKDLTFSYDSTKIPGGLYPAIQSVNASGCLITACDPAKGNIDFTDLRTGKLYCVDGKPNNDRLEVSQSYITDKATGEKMLVKDHHAIRFTNETANNTALGTLLGRFTPQHRYEELTGLTGTMNRAMTLPEQLNLHEKNDRNWMDIKGDKTLTVGKAASLYCDDFQTQLQYTLNGAWAVATDGRLYLKPDNIVIHGRRGEKKKDITIPFSINDLTELKGLREKILVTYLEKATPKERVALFSQMDQIYYKELEETNAPLMPSIERRKSAIYERAAEQKRLTELEKKHHIDGIHSEAADAKMSITRKLEKWTKTGALQIELYPQSQNSTRGMIPFSRNDLLLNETSAADRSIVTLNISPEEVKELENLFSKVQDGKSLSAGQKDYSTILASRNFPAKSDKQNMGGAVRLGNLQGAIAGPSKGIAISLAELKAWLPPETVKEYLAASEAYEKNAMKPAAGKNGAVISGTNADLLIDLKGWKKDSVIGQHAMEPFFVWKKQQDVSLESSAEEIMPGKIKKENFVLDELLQPSTIKKKLTPFEQYIEDLLLKTDQSNTSPKPVVPPIPPAVTPQPAATPAANNVSLKPEDINSKSLGILIGKQIPTVPNIATSSNKPGNEQTA